MAVLATAALTPAPHIVPAMTVPARPGSTARAMGVQVPATAPQMAAWSRRRSTFAVRSERGRRWYDADAVSIPTMPAPHATAATRSRRLVARGREGGGAGGGRQDGQGVLPAPQAWAGGPLGGPARHGLLDGGHRGRCARGTRRARRGHVGSGGRRRGRHDSDANCSTRSCPRSRSTSAKMLRTTRTGRSSLTTPSTDPNRRTRPARRPVGPDSPPSPRWPSSLWSPGRAAPRTSRKAASRPRPARCRP